MSSSTKQPSVKKRILIAEDDEQIAALLVRALEREYEVERALNGADALARASRKAPDLLLTDVMMPTMDGFHLAQRVRLLPGLAKLPIVFLTARDTPQDHIRGIQLGAKHFITKPFQVKALLDRLRSLLNP